PRPPATRLSSPHVTPPVIPALPHPPPSSTLFPYTTLFRSHMGSPPVEQGVEPPQGAQLDPVDVLLGGPQQGAGFGFGGSPAHHQEDHLLLPGRQPAHRPGE